MAGKGPPPSSSRRRANTPERGDWRPAPGIGWQHGKEPGKLPPCPQGLMPKSRAAWKAWFTSWFAAFWTPADLPGLRHVILLYDDVERGNYVRAGELRLQMDTYGITPKGQQDRRWSPPRDEPERPTAPKPSSRYEHLRAV